MRYLDLLLKRIALNRRLTLYGASLLVLGVLVQTLASRSRDSALVWTAPVEPPGTVIITQNQMLTPARHPLTSPLDATAPANLAPTARAQLLWTIEQWAEAWRKRDLPAYLAHYGPGFETPAGMNRQTWNEGRIARISSKEQIELSIRNLSVQIRDDRAIVRFRQLYADEQLRMTDQKTMVWVRQDGRWMIQKERTH